MLDWQKQYLDGLDTIARLQLNLSNAYDKQQHTELDAAQRPSKGNH